MARIECLDKQDIDKFEMTPVFKTKSEKNYFFNLSSQFYKYAIRLQDTNSFILFTLMLGYFKATNRFFEVDKFNQDDIEFVIKKYEFDSSGFTQLSATKRTIQRYKKIIKTYMGIHEYSIEIESKLLEYSMSLAKDFIHRKKIFFELVSYCKKLNIEIPSYTILSRIISNALNYQTESILHKLKNFMDDERLEVLYDFMLKDDDFKNRYNISKYKKLGHSTNKKHMEDSALYLGEIKSKFKILEPIIEQIGIDDKVAQYYSKWVEQSKTTQLVRKKDLEQYFLLLAFVKYQYMIRNDNLIDRFISIIQTNKNALLRYQKDISFENEPKQRNLMQSLEESNISLLNEFSSVLNNNNLNDAIKVNTLKSLIDTKTRDLTMILEDKKSLEINNLNKFDFLDGISRTLQGRLSKVLKLIEFDEKSSNRKLIEAISYFKNSDNITKTAPIEFLEEDEKLAVIEENKIKVPLYKSLLFIHISNGIKSGVLNLKYSYKYKSFEDYLIPKDEFNKNKNELFKLHEIELLKDFTEFIEPIKQKLEKSFETTNKRIQKELNDHFKFTIDSFIVSTPKLDKNDGQTEFTISKYFPKTDFISVINLLQTVQDKTNFLDCFNHHSLQNIKNKKLNQNLLYAAIMGYGCNISLSKMAKISKGVNENELDTTINWYLNEENTNKANDEIIAFTNDLEVSKILKNDQKINHTSSDGQKYNIKASIDSTNAGYSFKYFGTAKGVSVYTFIDESHKLFYSTVINVNERESGYVIDGLLNNETIKSDIHSTDTHGFSEVIFGITHLLGFSFAPRIKNFKKQQLYGVNFPKYYQDKDYQLVPKYKINFQIIEDKWDDIVRFILTIKSRKTSTSQLLKRLTSYSSQHKLYTAIKEFGKIIKTDFLLNYIDDVGLRQRIEKQLNKIEAANRFSKAVFFGNNHEMLFASREEQNIANNCKRLIQNAVILSIPSPKKVKV